LYQNINIIHISVPFQAIKSLRVLTTKFGAIWRLS
jgi:hypothetical protein